ncbi:hypothetical protein RFX30_17165, partial [Acinetobacter baumannii]|nr:hypothetical protein [Acinetobacter baumannii]
MIEAPTGKSGSKSVTTGMHITLRKVAILNDAIPPIRLFIASLPSWYLIEIDTVIPTHNGPDKGGNGAKIPKITFLIPLIKFERLE